MLEKRDFNSLIDISKDIITHPIEDVGENEYLLDILDSEIFTQAEIDEINKALSIILSNTDSEKRKLDIAENLWKVNFWAKPPTPEEFLTEAWLGETAHSVYPHVKDAFLRFFDININYRNLVEYWPIGTGKSFLVSLCKSFIAIQDYYLRNPKQFFKLSQATHLVDATVSLTLEMAYDLNIRPMLNWIETSPKFRRSKMESQMIKRVKDEPQFVHYTTATKGNSILRMGDLHYNVVSEPAQLLGLSIQTASLTELAFMVEKGMKQETIMRLLNDTKSRVYSRFGNHYLARTIVDSSPNDLNNLVDRYIYYDCEKDPTVLKLTGRKWELQPHLFPEWQKTNEIFLMFRGNAANSALVIEDENEAKKFDPTEIEYVPIDIKQLALDNPTKIVKDYCGFPSGLESRLISNPETIEGIFKPFIKNFYTFRNAPASMPPEGLLWSIVKKEGLFVPTGGSLYQFHRYPSAERFLSFDLAKKFDMACASLVHLEMNRKGERIFYVDFSLPIMSTKEEINMEAFQWLAYDMARYGSINLKAVSYDGFQSDTSIQFLNRHNIPCYYQSMDKSVEPYMNFISTMGQKRIVMGRNLIMKNNLKSLIMQRIDGKRNKVEHEKGNWMDLNNLEWTTSRMGYFGKDLSDSVVAACTLANLHGTDKADFVYDEEIEVAKGSSKGSIEIMKKELREKLNLAISNYQH